MDGSLRAGHGAVEVVRARGALEPTHRLRPVPPPAASRGRDRTREGGSGTEEGAVELRGGVFMWSVLLVVVL